MVIADRVVRGRRSRIKVGGSETIIHDFRNINYPGGNDPMKWTSMGGPVGSRGLSEADATHFPPRYSRPDSTDRTRGIGSIRLEHELLQCAIRWRTHSDGKSPSVNPEQGRRRRTTPRASRHLRLGGEGVGEPPPDQSLGIGLADEDHLLPAIPNRLGDDRRQRLEVPSPS